MTKSDKSVMHQALDALENLELDGDYAENFWAKRNEAIDALRGAIAQPEPRGTDAQILKEREITTSAIVGAMAYGFQNGEYPPDDSAWLRPFWEMGRHDAKRQAAIAQPEQPDAENALSNLLCELDSLAGNGMIPWQIEDAFAEYQTAIAQPKQPTPVRQPLTDDEIDELFTSIRAELCAIGGGDEQIPQVRRCIARAVEAAHGIAQTKDKP